MYMMKRELWIGMIVILVFDVVVVLGVADIIKNGDKGITGAIVGRDAVNSMDEVQVEESNLTDEITGTFVITNSSIVFRPDEKTK